MKNKRSKLLQGIDVWIVSKNLLANAVDEDRNVTPENTVSYF